MAVESSGKSPGNPRMYELIEDAPKDGPSTVWAWPQIVEYMKVAAQPVQGPWPPHQNRRPDPDADSMPTAVPDSHSTPPAPPPAAPPPAAPTPPPAPTNPDRPRED